jgi:hypothetical protein
MAKGVKDLVKTWDDYDRKHHEDLGGVSATPEYWQAFHKHFFGIETSFDDVGIPEDPGNLQRVMFIPKELTYKMIFEYIIKTRMYSNELDTLQYYADGFDEHIVDRRPNKSYAVRIYKEPYGKSDMKYYNLTAQEVINREGVGRFSTLKESLIYAIFSSSALLKRVEPGCDSYSFCMDSTMKYDGKWHVIGWTDSYMTYRLSIYYLEMWERFKQKKFRPVYILPFE